MSASLFRLYMKVGGLAKNDATTAAAHSAHVANVMQDGYRRWFEGVTASLGETIHIVQDLGRIRSPSDIVGLQRVWLQSASARTAENVKILIDLSQKLVAATTTQGVTTAPALLESPASESPVTKPPTIEAG